MKLLRLVTASLLAATPALSQLAPSNAQGVSMGHIHLNAADPVAATAFWTDLVGAQPYTHGSFEGRQRSRRGHLIFQKGPHRPQCRLLC